jgi:diguanylate cyclase (GGDEF)-like protein
MAGRRILIIEDDASIRQVLKYQLEAEGYEVVMAGGGAAGLELVQKDPPDLVITDLMMPEMDGHQVCRFIKSHFRTSHVPVIMLTAKSDLSSKVRALDFGANDFLSKPYERDEMLLRVRNLLNWSRSQREANPLTGLPGNVAIEKEVNRRLAAAEPFLFLYLDIDNFKAYNDHYGYLRGDEAIRLLARILVEVIMEHGTPSDFVGHVGGDDFVVLTSPEALTVVPSRIIERFDCEVVDLFTPLDKEAGSIRVLNRRGEMEQFALMSLTIAVVPSNKYRITHIGQLNDLASELKRYGKSQRGSIAVCERRGEDLESPSTGTEG